MTKGRRNEIAFFIVKKVMEELLKTISVEEIKKQAEEILCGMGFSLEETELFSQEIIMPVL